MFKIKFWLNLCLLIFSPILLFTLKATAGLLGDYTASSEAKKIEQRRTVGSGSRSDCHNSASKNSVTLLVPQAEVVHQTTSIRPSFYLYSQIVSSEPFKFTLVNPQIAKPIVEKSLAISQPGIKQIELPETTSLKEGTVYLWYVAIPCSNDPQQYQEILGAAVELVPLPSKVATQLETTTSNSETAAIYASNGFWYEALDFALGERSDYLQQLLWSAGITNQDIANK